ncbi:MAG: hypothetical protein ACREBU_13865 [Nitrososphaera sp.]
MTRVEVYSWLFVCKQWAEFARAPSWDKGFEDSFRQYLYSKISFDVLSDLGDTGFGLSYDTLSGVPHELDVICRKDRHVFVFELKHYEISSLSKEIVFTFLGKVIDFYIRNPDSLSSYKITMLLVTINKNVDDAIRALCLAYGIRLIEPSIMTLAGMDYFARDLYEKLGETGGELKLEVARFIENLAELREHYNYSFSDLFRYRNGSIELGPVGLGISPSAAVGKIARHYREFEKLWQRWKAKTN